jgi:hypothetical protein
MQRQFTKGPGLSVCVCVCEREREREREVLLTITKWLKVGKHNALMGDTAPVRTGSSIDGEYSTPTLSLAMWPAWARG